MSEGQWTMFPRSKRQLTWTILLLVLVVVVLTTHDQWTLGDQIILEPHFDQVEKVDGVYKLPVTVTNDSSQAVAPVVVSGTLDSGETSWSSTPGVISAGGKRTAILEFESLPREGDLELDFYIDGG